MRIIHITPYYAPAYSYGGVVSVVVGQAETLARRGHEVTVLTTDTLTREERYAGEMDEIINGVHVLRHRNMLPLLRGRLNLSTPVNLRKKLSTLISDTDVIHLHEFRTVENLQIASLLATYEVSVVLSPHGTLIHSTGRSTLKQLWDKWLSPRIAPHIQHIIALTSQEKYEIAAVWQAFGTMPEMSVIPNGVDLQAFSDLPDSDAFREKYNLAGKRVVLFMGRLHARKGVEALVRAFKQANIANTVLLLAGPDEGMKETLSPLLDESIILTGFISGQERLAALACADVFALPATGEGLSMAVLEAMAAGIPVILSPGCNLPEAAEAGAGIIVEPQIEPLMAAIQKLLSDTEKRIAMGQAAQHLIQERFTWDRVVDQLEDVYQGLQRN